MGGAAGPAELSGAWSAGAVAAVTGAAKQEEMGFPGTSSAMGRVLLEVKQEVMEVVATKVKQEVIEEPVDQTRGFMEVLAAEARQAARTELKQSIFTLLDVDRDGFLNRDEMRIFADLSGFDGDDEAWQEDFQVLWEAHGGGLPQGLSFAAFSAALDDDSDDGAHCTDKELEKACQKLLALRQAAMAAQHPPAVPVVSASWETAAVQAKEDLAAAADHFAVKQEEDLPRATTGVPMNAEADEEEGMSDVSRDDSEAERDILEVLHRAWQPPSDDESDEAGAADPDDGDGPPATEIGTEFATEYLDLPDPLAAERVDLPSRAPAGRAGRGARQMAEYPIFGGEDDVGSVGQDGFLQPRARLRGASGLQTPRPPRKRPRGQLPDAEALPGGLEASSASGSAPAPGDRAAASEALHELEDELLSLGQAAARDSRQSVPALATRIARSHLRAAGAPAVFGAMASVFLYRAVSSKHQLAILYVFYDLLCQQVDRAERSLLAREGSRYFLDRLASAVAGLPPAVRDRFMDVLGKWRKNMVFPDAYLQRLQTDWALAPALPQQRKFAPPAPTSPPRPTPAVPAGVRKGALRRPKARLGAQDAGHEAAPTSPAPTSPAARLGRPVRQKRPLPVRDTSPSI